MASKEISAGVGIPMIIVGALIAFVWAQSATRMQETIEFVGGLIGIIGVVFLISGFFYAKEQNVQSPQIGSPQNNEEHFRHYCVKCKEPRRVINPQEVTMKNGRPAVKGNCEVCGSTVFRIGRMPNY